MKYLLHFLLFLVLCFGTPMVWAQPFQIGHTTLNFTDPGRNNRVIATEIYYPADVAGDNVALASTGGAFPVLAFGHGFVMTWDAYQNFWAALVPQGYIMVFPKTEGSISPSHLEFGRDLAFVLNQMTQLGTTSASIFFNRVSPMNAVMGHSMGGGASFLAVPLNSAITTLVTFAPAETNPSAINAAASITIPSLIFSGGNDCVTPPVGHQIPMYTGLTSSCKTIINIQGGSHCQMANSNFFCNVGESSCTPQPSISRAVQQSIINLYLIPWLDYQLKGNCSQGTFFDTQITANPAITFQRNCTLCNGLSTDTVESDSEITVYPVPAHEFVVFKGIEGLRYRLQLFDSQSKRLLQQEFTSTTIVETATLAHGVYFYVIDQEGRKSSSGKIIK